MNSPCKSIGNYIIFWYKLKNCYISMLCLKYFNICCFLIYHIKSVESVAFDWKSSWKYVGDCRAVSFATVALIKIVFVIAINFDWPTKKPYETHLWLTCRTLYDC